MIDYEKLTKEVDRIIWAWPLIEASNPGQFTDQLKLRHCLQFNCVELVKLRLLEGLELYD